MNALMMSCLTPYAPGLFDLSEMPSAEETGFATVTVGSRRTAQGNVLRRFWDGRVTVDAGGVEVTGLPVGTANPAPARGWFGRG